MTKQTILKLNELTAGLYAENAKEFSQSRDYYWEGWLKVLPHLVRNRPEGSILSVLDVGCGNGRFGKFLSDHFRAENIEYTGLDNSALLLKECKDTLPSNLTKNLIKTDLVQFLLEENDEHFSKQKYDVVVLFGLLHHIPSLELRERLLQWSAEALKPNGLLIFSCWQFMDFERFRKKITSPIELGLEPTNLEKNDYILDWQRGSKSYRYCHFANQEEQEKIKHSLLKKNPRLEFVTHFAADAKEGSGNHYLLFRAT